LSECPDENLLGAYIERQATPKEVAVVEAHLADCRVCREVVFLVLESKEVVPDPALPDFDKR
jgi:hypothetical protein